MLPLQNVTSPLGEALERTSACARCGNSGTVGIVCRKPTRRWFQYQPSCFPPTNHSFMLRLWKKFTRYVGFCQLTNLGATVAFRCFFVALRFSSTFPCADLTNAQIGPLKLRDPASGASGCDPLPGGYSMVCDRSPRRHLPRSDRLSSRA